VKDKGEKEEYNMNTTKMASALTGIDPYLLMRIDPP
jgi:hypothetical protein